MERRLTGRWSTTTALAPLLSLATVVACGMELPSRQRVISTRIIGLKNEVVAPLPVDPPEDTEADGVRCQALPLETVRFTPFIVDAEDVVDPAEIRPIWIACELPPGQGLFGCLQSAIPLEAPVSLPECPQVGLFDLDPETLENFELPEFPSPCRIPDDDTPGDGLQDFIVPLTTNGLIGGSMEITMVGQGPDGPPAEQCAGALLAGETDIDNSCIIAVQRLTIGPIEQLIQLVETFGVTLPPELLESFPIADEVPDGDRNPRITSFNVTIAHKDGTTTEIGEVERGGVVTVAPDDRLDITTEAPESDLQTYLVPINGGRDGFDERTEDYGAQWFRTWGDLLAGTSNDPVSRNEWSMIKGNQDETERPPGDRATLYYVLRDGRQGTDWWWIHAEME